jgi:dipeptidyl-peptidase-4
MALRAMLVANDAYHVGIAVAPVGELTDHTGLTETYMDLPANNPEGYRHSSNLRLVDNLKGKLLLVHGAKDPWAPFLHTMKIVDALMRADKPYDLIVDPVGGHIPSEYWHKACGRYFVEHLMP